MQEKGQRFHSASAQCFFPAVPENIAFPPVSFTELILTRMGVSMVTSHPVLRPGIPVVSTTGNLDEAGPERQPWNTKIPHLGMLTRSGPFRSNPSFRKKAPL